jgi:MarR family transcriptional regulator, transcriptional regulator for hemolysin
MSYPDPYESLGFQCTLTVKAWNATLEKKLRSTGVAPAQFMALGQLIALGPLSQSELANLLSITPATSVRLVDRMERDGWVVRQPDARNYRIKRVVPTKRAVKIRQKVSRAAKEALREAYLGIDASDIEIVKRVLGHVRKNLGA